MLAMLATGAK